METQNYYQSLSEASPDAFPIPDAAYVSLSERQGRNQKCRRVTTKPLLPKTPRTTPTGQDSRKPALKAAEPAPSPPQERRPQEPRVNPGREAAPRTNFALLQREGTSSPSEDALENTTMAQALS